MTKIGYLSVHLMRTYFANFQLNDIRFQPMREHVHVAKGNLLSDGFFAAAGSAIDRTLDGPVVPFRRHILLPRLIPVGPAELADLSFATRLRIVRRLARALRGERARGRAGHWTYSLNRHVGLLQAYKAERTALRELFPGKAGRMA